VRSASIVSRSARRWAVTWAFSLVTAGVLANCSWGYFVPESVPDAETDGGDTGSPDVDLDTGPAVLCVEAGVKSGEAVPCSCADDGGPVPEVGPDADAGPIGYRPCTVEAGLGACVGCPPTTSCDGVTVPIGTTCVPGGVVSLGVANDKVCSPSGCALEMPEHLVALSRFVIDDHEVTVKRFRAWWSLGHVAPKEGDVIFTAGDETQVRWGKGWVVTEPAKNDGKNDATWLGETDTANDAAPINFVDWPTALAFCVANGGRLPTEAEWESTASGHANRLFPFSPDGSKKNAPTAADLPCTHAISAASGTPCTFKTSAANGFSPDNAYDLAGSVAEWVLDMGPPGGTGCTTNCYPSAAIANPLFYNEAAKLRGVRGGHWADSDPKRLRAQARDFLDMSTRDAHTGFRCVSK